MTTDRHSLNKIVRTVTIWTTFSRKVNPHIIWLLEVKDNKETKEAPTGYNKRKRRTPFQENKKIDINKVCD
jgi:hypothetical protein